MFTGLKGALKPRLLFVSNYQESFTPAVYTEAQAKKKPLLFSSGLNKTPPAIDGQGILEEQLLFSEFRIGFHTTLADIQTFIFFLLIDSNAHDGFDNAPGNQAGNEYPSENSRHAD